MVYLNLYLALYFSYWVGNNAQFLLPDSPAAKARWSNLSSLEEYSKEVTTTSKAANPCNRGFCAIDTTGKCGQNMTEKWIVNSTNESNPIIKVCFDETKVQTIYTEHYYYELHVDSCNKSYVWKDDVAVLKNTIYNKAYAGFTGIDRGHLTPKCDLGKPGGRFTYFWINSSPQWIIINRGIWLNVEKHVRSKYSKGVTVYTGNLGILSEADLNNQNPAKDIYLWQNQIPIPKFLWKVALSTDEKVPNTLYVVHNNPLINQTRYEMNSPCGTVCETNCERIELNLGSAQWGVFCYRFKGNKIPCPAIAKLRGEEPLMQEDANKCS